MVGVGCRRVERLEVKSAEVGCDVATASSVGLYINLFWEVGIGVVLCAVRNLIGVWLWFVVFILLGGRLRVGCSVAMAYFS